MAIRYYDDAIVNKLKKWIADNSKLRVLKPDESKRLFETLADDKDDRPMQLPIVALSRDTSIELISNIKQNKSFDGLRLASNEKVSVQMNVIPVKVEYQLDIYTKTYEEGDEYLRNFLFKLINNPTIIIDIPYNEINISHIANLRVLDTVTDTSDISERLFSGQFTRWSIKIELQDGFLFSIPYRNNWTFVEADIEVCEKIQDLGEIEAVFESQE